MGKITFWEYFSVFLWGVAIDFDHFLSWSYVKDLPARIKRGGGMPARDVKIPISWLHLWPGFVLVWLWGFAFHYFVSSFRLYIPFVFWLLHVVTDYFQKNLDYNPHRSPLYPFHKKTWVPKFGYPIKSPSEFILGDHIWMVISFILLGILILR